MASRDDKRQNGHERLSQLDSKGSDRRNFLKGTAAAAATGGAIMHELSHATPAAALEGAASEGAGLAPNRRKVATELFGENWWPSKWGAEDQAGAANHMGPAKTLEAVSRITNGTVYQIGRVYEAGMPLFGSRVFGLRIPGAPTGGVFGRNKIIWNDEFLATEIGQVGTQFDGLGHIGVEAGNAGDQNERRFYNGVPLSEMAGPYGLQKLGMEHVKPFFTPGVLIDIKGLKGGMLKAGTEVTVADLEAALERQGLSGDAITPGDAVVIRTGWGDLWMEDNARYNSGEPGIGVEAAEWLAEKDVCLVGADCWGIEVVPNPDADLAFPAHQILLTKHGIYLHENLVLDSIAEAEVWQFAYIFAPLPIKGATGSPGAPVAVA
ncbi:cyclase family protein [Algihabitans sp.]|uniref:cyclase family protein n=1 Tax=Algihabitans sp. TaxID=2821514 RepID=UPI003BA879F9